MTDSEIILALRKLKHKWKSCDSTQITWGLYNPLTMHLESTYWVSGLFPCFIYSSLFHIMTNCMEGMAVLDLKMNNIEYLQEGLNNSWPARIQSDAVVISRWRFIWCQKRKVRERPWGKREENDHKERRWRDHTERPWDRESRRSPDEQVTKGFVISLPGENRHRQCLDQSKMARLRWMVKGPVAGKQTA